MITVRITDCDDDDDDDDDDGDDDDNNNENDDENQDILGFIFCSVAPKRLDKQMIQQKWVDKHSTRKYDDDDDDDNDNDNNDDCEDGYIMGVTNKKCRETTLVLVRIRHLAFSIFSF